MALIPVVAPTLTGEFASPVVGVAVGVGAAGLVGVVIAPLFAGWVTIPACALVGYVLARRRIDTEGPTAGDH